MFGMVDGLRVEKSPSTSRAHGTLDVVGVSDFQDSLVRFRAYEVLSNSDMWVAVRRDPGMPGTDRECRVEWVLPDWSGTLQVGRVPGELTALWSLQLTLMPFDTLWVWLAETTQGDGAAIGLRLYL